jgi:two-component SAPR family response regulator
MSIEEIRCDMFAFSKCNGNDRKQVEAAIKLYKGLPFENKDYVWAKSMQMGYHAEYIRLLRFAIAFYKKEADRTMLQYYEDKLQLAQDIQI